MSQEKKSLEFFGKNNVIWMIAGAALIIIGMLAMMGGKSDNPNVFDPNEVYSFRRITIAPILIIAGFIVEIFAIFKKK
jgi:energy-converting hydrogenase Eha subunit E